MNSQMSPSFIGTDPVSFNLSHYVKIANPDAVFHFITLRKRRATLITEREVE